MPDPIWDEKSALADLLFDTNHSFDEIAAYFDWSRSELSRQIKLNGLDWVRRSSKKMSRGQASLTHIMKRLIPGGRIINEHHIGERLRIDVYCPDFKLAAEYHGRQHYIHIPAFHETYDDFLRAQQRDERKLELCRENGIILVGFKYSDELTEDAVYNRLLDAIRSTPVLEEKPFIKPKVSISGKGSPQYDAIKSKRREFERDLRRKIKQERKTREQDRTPTDEEPDGLY
jgi:hypothetical protein